MSEAGPQERRTPRGRSSRAGPGAAVPRTARTRTRRLSPAEVERRAALVPKVTYPEELPVSARRDDIAAAIRDHQVVIVAGETGSGKTTQIPKICLELGRGVHGMIGHTQPRRIAARSVAERIAEEIGHRRSGRPSATRCGSPTTVSEDTPGQADDRRHPARRAPARPDAVGATTR